MPPGFNKSTELETLKSTVDKLTESIVKLEKVVAELTEKRQASPEVEALKPVVFTARMQLIPTNSTQPFYKNFNSLDDFLVWRNDCAFNSHTVLHWIKDTLGRTHYGLILEDGSLSRFGPALQTDAYRSQAFLAAEESFKNPPKAVLA